MSNKLSEAQVAGFLLKGMLAEAPPEIREKVAAAADKVRAVVAEYGDEGKVALALVIAEVGD